MFIAKTSIIGIDGRRYFSLFDDAMIAMRYAWNLVHGYGLVWNIGERVEGYTSLLMVGVMAPLNALFPDKRYAVLGVQVLGIATLLAIGLVARAALRRLSHLPNAKAVRRLELLHGIATLFYYPLAYFTLMGMETGLLTLLLLGAVVLALRAEGQGAPRDLFATAVLLGLAYLTRPDALIFAALIFGWLAVRAWRVRARPAWVKGFAASLAVFALFVISQLTFRWLYYGELVPNTYVLKVEGFPLALRIKNGLAYVRPFFIEFLPLGVLAGLALVLDFSEKRLLVVALFLSSVAYTIWIGGDAWRNWRLITPTVPLMMALALEELARLIAVGGAVWKGREDRPALAPAALWRTPGWLAARTRLPGSNLRIVVAAALVILALTADELGISGAGFGDEQRVLLLVGLGLFILPAFVRWAGRGKGWRASSTARVLWISGVILALLVANRRFLPELAFRTLPFDVEWNVERVHRSEVLLEVTSEQATIGVTAAGVVPYYTGRRAYDFLGRVDEHIARLPADVSGAMASGSMLTWPGHNKYDLEYSIGRLRPTYVQRLRWGSDDLCSLLGRAYVAVDLEGQRFYFLIGSPDVRWDLLEQTGKYPPIEGACLMAN